MTTISLKVPDELVARMDAVAHARRTSRSALLREALEEKLKVVARETPPSLYERIRNTSKDLARERNHRRYRASGRLSGPQ